MTHAPSQTRSNASSTIPISVCALGPRVRSVWRSTSPWDSFLDAHRSLYDRALAESGWAMLGAVAGARETPQRKRRVVCARDLRPEVEQAVACVDLSAPKREAVGRRQVDAGLARHRKRVASAVHQLPLALAEEPRGKEKSRDAASQPILELGPRAGQLPFGLDVVDREEDRGWSQRVRFEAECAATVELPMSAQVSNGAAPAATKLVRPSVTRLETKTVVSEAVLGEHL